MNNLQIDRVTGGFIVTTPTERGVACSVHALVAAVQVWATSEAMDYETTLACAAPPPVAPDAAPAPFRVGDRVVLKDATRKLMGSTGPWEIADVGACRARIHVPGSGLRDWFFTPNELRHAPVEDL